MEWHALETKNQEKSFCSADDCIKTALLETLPPIADYSLAIQILKKGYSKFCDIRIAILISFLMSTWENYLKNDFLIILSSSQNIENAETNAIIQYLKAYDIFMHNKVIPYRNEYKRLLKESIRLYPQTVFPYYFLSQVSKKRDALWLIDKALSNVIKIESEQDCEQKSTDLLTSYDSFVDENILGVNLTSVNYERIESQRALFLKKQ